jgi:basic membrane lipoprotein Med (substrate-binding protein (PBP1-ABC) superfamily)
VKIWIKAVSLLFALIPASCSRGSLVFLVAEPYWQSIGESEGAADRALLDAAHAHGLGLARVVIGVTENTADRLARALSRIHSSTVVVAPPLSFDALALAAGHPSVRFILIDAPESPSESPNVMRLLFDREEAFHTMGLAVGMKLKGGASPGGTRAAVLLPRSASSASSEITAFMKGAKEGSGGEEPAVVTLDDPLDNAKVQKSVQDLRAKGVEFFFPRLGEYNSACLDALKAAGGFMVTEDWQGSGAHPEIIFLSVEEDIAGGIDKCLSASPDLRMVYGPVRVVCGKALPVPKELTQIECR